MPHTNLLPFEPPEEPLRVSRTGFENIPADVSKAELFRYFTYSVEDRHAIFECRGRQNNVGFALLLGCIRLTGRFPLHYDTCQMIPASQSAHARLQTTQGGWAIAARLSVAPGDIARA